MRDFDLVQRCLEGDDLSIRTLRNEHGPYLQSVLSSYGASSSDGEEIVGLLWADCVVSLPGRPPLFSRYDGRSDLRPWLIAIAVNRWISRMRKQTVRTRAHAEIDATATAAALGEGEPMVDPELVAALEKALRGAFAGRQAEDIVILQLVHLHGLTQREIAGVWGWHESRVSRSLRETERQIAEATLRSLAEFDPALNLQWSDFLRLCESTNLLLF